MINETSLPDATHLPHAFLERLRAYEDARYVYTYPFKGAYRPLTDLESTLQGWNAASGPLNVYIHVPYCNMKCTFCNLLTTTRHDGDTLNRYTHLLSREVTLLSNLVNLGQYEVVSLYFGGGTPTLLASDLLQAILSALNQVMPFSAKVEMAIEAAPDSINRDQLASLRSMGFDRISFGVQTFDAEELSGLARNYNKSCGERAVDDALSVGFRNVNVDLIYGLPEQPPQKWMQSLQRAVDLSAPTITIYPLVFRSRTHLGRVHEVKPQTFPNDTSRYDLYTMAVDFLQSNSYRQCTMASFTNLEEACSHEANEFCGVPTLGLGAGALSYSPTAHYSSGLYSALEPSSHTISAYLACLENNILPIRSGILLDADELERRYVILGLLYSGIDKDAYLRRFGLPVEERFPREIQLLCEEGCLEQAGARLSLSIRGRYSSSLIADLFASPQVRQLATAYR